jgi:hypothetical protein
MLIKYVFAIIYKNYTQLKLPKGSYQPVENLWSTCLEKFPDSLKVKFKYQGHRNE